MNFQLEVVFPSNQHQYDNFKLNYDENQLQTVGELKTRVALRFYLPTNNFQFIYNQKHLADDKQKLSGLLKPSIKRLYAIPILSITAESEAFRRAKQNQIDPSYRRNINANLKLWMDYSKQEPKQYRQEMQKLGLMLEKNNRKVKKMLMFNQLLYFQGDVEKAYRNLTKE